MGWLSDNWWKVGMALAVLLVIFFYGLNVLQDNSLNKQRYYSERRAACTKTWWSEQERTEGAFERFRYEEETDLCRLWFYDEKNNLVERSL